MLTEQVRVLADESSLIDVATEYSVMGTAWQTLHDYGNVTLSKAALIVLSFQDRVGTGYTGSIRIKIGGTYFIVGVTTTSDAYETFTVIGYFAAGTYDVLARGRNNDAAHSTFIKNFKLGIVNFSDEVGQTMTTYASAISKTVASRETCAGALKQAAIVVTCFAQTPAGQANFENVGETLTNGVSMTVDSVQVSWTRRYQDTVSIQSASAIYYGVVTVGSAHTVAISKRNANTVVYISVYLCPWILGPSDLEPVTMNFPPASTLYVTLEPLDLNPTKNLKIGKKRSVSFGDAMDYYYTATGTNIVAGSYTLEPLEPGDNFLIANGTGGCISIIAVDLR